MLANLNDVLKVAQLQHFAVGAFNTIDIETTDAIISAAEAMRSPVIVQTSEKAIEYAGFKEISAVIRTRAIESTVPVVFHLDHGRTHQTIYDCIDGGWTSIMFDGSHLPYDENVRWTKEMAHRAHAKGLSLEAELGCVGGVEDSIDAEVQMTDPAMAHDFVAQTHCNALAVGIGNNHGKPRLGEKLHLDLLAKIAEVVTTPLVLHGASSTPENDIRRAIALGITKINIDTDLRVAFNQAERDFLAHDKTTYDPRAILAPGKEAIFETVKAKMALFGSHLKAKEIGL